MRVRLLSIFWGIGFIGKRAIRPKGGCYSSEQRQFRGGTTTFYLVLQRQTDLTVTRGREHQAQTDLNKAISEFSLAIGTTLTVNNVTVSK